MNHRLFLAAAVAASVLAVAGCKKDSSNKEIQLPEGQIHVGAQWVGEELWIESLDPKTGTCTFSQYKDNKPVEASTITLKNCKVSAMGGPMMRPGMPGRPEMMGRPGMPPRPGMMPPEGKPGAAPADARPQAAAPAKPAVPAQ